MKITKEWIEEFQKSMSSYDKLTYLAYMIFERLDNRITELEGKEKCPECLALVTPKPDVFPNNKICPNCNHMWN